jgi:hypothetical protein
LNSIIERVSITIPQKHRNISEPGLKFSMQFLECVSAVMIYGARCSQQQRYGAQSSSRQEVFLFPFVEKYGET